MLLQVYDGKRKTVKLGKKTKNIIGAGIGAIVITIGAIFEIRSKNAVFIALIILAGLVISIAAVLKLTKKVKMFIMRRKFLDEARDAAKQTMKDVPQDQTDDLADAYVHYKYGKENFREWIAYGDHLKVLNKAHAFNRVLKKYGIEGRVETKID